MRVRYIVALSLVVLAGFLTFAMCVGIPTDAEDLSRRVSSLWETACNRTSSWMGLEPPAAKEPSERNQEVAPDRAGYLALDHDDPRAVVHGFLTATRRADRWFAEQLLTDRARQALREEGVGLAISRPCPSVAIRVEAPEIVEREQTVAYVRSFWTDTEVNHSMVPMHFVLRKDRLGPQSAGPDNGAPGSGGSPDLAPRVGWRISGMVAGEGEWVEIFDLESRAEWAALADRPTAIDQAPEWGG